MTLRKLLSYVLILTLTAGCANRFANLETHQTECGYRTQPFRVFATCLKPKLEETLKPQESLAQQNQGTTHKASGEASDHLVPDFLKEVQKLTQQAPKAKKNAKLTAADSQAYRKFDTLLKTYQDKEKELNAEAKGVAALVGIAILAGAATYNYMENQDDDSSGGSSTGFSSASSPAYPGNCPCPYNLDSLGNLCGARSAYCRSGGAEPVCYPFPAPTNACY